MNKVLYVVVPCYNEEEVLPGTISALTAQLGEMIGSGIISDNSRILFVDDGSTGSVPAAAETEGSGCREVW